MSRAGRVAAPLGPVLPSGRGGASGPSRRRRRERPAGPFPGSRDSPCPAGLPGPTAPPPGLGQAGGAGATRAGRAPPARGPGQSRRARCLRGDALLCFALLLTLPRCRRMVSCHLLRGVAQINLVLGLTAPCPVSQVVNRSRCAGRAQGSRTDLLLRRQLID